MTSSTKDGNPTPIARSIGIALSGGGSRATCFHLGTLDYLQRVDLLPQVRILSSVSGGTFVGAKYALSMAEGLSFDQFFREFFYQLRDTQVLKRALAKIGLAKPGVPSGRRNLIVSAAQVYAETFLCGSDGNPYLLGQLLDAPASFALREVVFNATEYRLGTSFRFQRTRTGFIGNGDMRIPEQDARHIRVADIVAASSCLPGGFEPMAFPDDFAWPGGEVPATTRALFSRDGQPQPVPLMDGGIFDNQGTYGLMLANERQPDPYELDLVIISDADRKDEDIYPYPKHPDGEPLGTPNTPQGPTLRSIGLASRALVAACVVSAASIAWRAFEHRPDGYTLVDIFTYLVPFLLAVGTGAGMLWLIREVHRFLAEIPQTNGAAWEDIKRLGIRRVLDGINLRLGSVLASSNAVMPKRSRDLGYALLYRDPHYRDRRISNLIYQLRDGEGFERLGGADQAWRAAAVPPPTAALMRVIDYAATMDTRFWFEADYEIPCVVACGQATICVNLMKFIVRHHPRDPDSGRYQPAVQALWEQLRADWDTLREDPYALFRARAQCCAIDDADLRLPPAASD